MSPAKIIRQARHILIFLENSSGKDATLAAYQKKITTLLSSKDSNRLADIIIEIDGYFARQGQDLKNKILESLPA